jgi:hypothetical protein
MNKLIALSVIVILLSITLVSAETLSRESAQNVVESYTSPEIKVIMVSSGPEIKAMSPNDATETYQDENISAQIVELNKRVNEQETLLSKILNFFKSIFGVSL